MPASVVGYLEIAATLLSGSLRDVIVLRRERVLRGLGLDPRRAMPSYRRLPLAGSTVVQRITQTVHPELFGRELRDELAAGESALAKSVQKLRQRSRHERSGNKAKRLVEIHSPKINQAAATPVQQVFSERIAGRFQDFADCWFKLTNDPLVRNTVMGYTLPFRETPSLTVPQYLCRHTSEALSTALEELLEKGAIAKARKGSPVWISTMFPIPKKDGTWRPIINLKPLNQFLKVPHFKMEGLHLVPEIVKQGDYCAKIDMTDAYFAVNIAEDSRPFLAFFWGSEIFWFTCLPFGLATAPYIYTKLMRVIMEHLRTHGIRLISYLDDWAFFAETAELLHQQLDYALRTFENLGLRINREKSILKPCQRIEFLGVILDTSLGVFELPQSKLAKIRDEAESLLCKGVVKAREIAKFLGRANFVGLVIPFSTHFTRALQGDLARSVSPHDTKSFENQVSLSERAREDLAWFRDHICEHSGASFCRNSPDITMSCDASKAGWGAVCCGLKTGGRWSRDESLDHINLLELKAIYFGLKSFGKKWRDTTVLIESDNTAAIAYVKKRGGTKSKHMSTVAKQIWEWTLGKNIRLLVTHRPGIQNREADKESRTFTREHAEWSLDPQTALTVFTHFGKPEVDLFASRLNAKLPHYYSLNYDPGAERIDSFAQNWSGIFGYAFPPFNLIGRTIRKAICDGTRIILITPLWKSQSWFPLALEHACRPPTLLRSQNLLLVDRDGNPHPLLKQKRFCLVAWEISPTPGKALALKLRRSARYWPAGLLTLSDNTNQP
ncbi:reverse transcriptase [Oesophagostomum dentatum]|uniref:Reverse transcriptase n=1 Tax=Oesophagostomum dentatum TaxID=61180 RepID=A0A0B1TFB7_OESDE|nr:reverse transcriptase [Oesophagostomum dentatum]